MNFRDEKKKKEKIPTTVEDAIRVKKKFDKRMKGKKKILIPHPTIPKTWIVKYE